MKSLVRSALFIFILLIIGCKEENAQIEIWHDEVMAVHDEVMPKLSDIQDVRKRIRNKITGDADASDSTKRIWQMAVDSLQLADDEMMAWMKNYEKADSKDLAAAKKYYEQEMQKIVDVSDLMKTSLAKGKELINE